MSIVMCDDDDDHMSQSHEPIVYRKLFTEAEDEQVKMGSASGLHIIIFDEIDAICKERGTVVSSCVCP